MKILDKITLILFSILILVIGIVVALLMIGFVDITTITMLYELATASTAITNTILVISAICIVLALKAIFFGSSTSSRGGVNGEGVLLENEAGRLLISKDTIENLVNGVAKGFENTQSVTTKVIIDSQNELRVFVNLMVLPDTVINELSVNMQSRIKEVVKTVTDLEIKSIDIKIKNITTPDEKKEG